MRRARNVAIAWLGGIGLAIIASAGGALDQFTGTRALAWTFGILALLVFVGLSVLLFLAAFDMNRSDACRTADFSQIDRETRRLQDQVPTPAPAAAKHKCTVTQFTLDVDRVTREARAAAMADRISGKVTPNPYQQASRAFPVWAIEYASAAHSVEWWANREKTREGTAPAGSPAGA